MNERERAQRLVAASEQPVLVLDHERRVVASNVGLAEGRRVGDVEDVLVLFLGEVPELSAYQELRASGWQPAR